MATMTAEELRDFLSRFITTTFEQAAASRVKLSFYDTPDRPDIDALPRNEEARDIYSAAFELAAAFTNAADMSLKDSTNLASAVFKDVVRAQGLVPPRPGA